MDKNEKKNIIIVFLLSILIFVAFDHYFKPNVDDSADKSAQTQSVQEAKKIDQEIDAVLLPREEALKKSDQRIALEHEKIHGTINLNGGRFDDLTFVDYRETPDPKSPEVVLLNPSATQDPYYVDFGWKSSITEHEMPSQNTKWVVLENVNHISTKQPITLVWENKTGLKFERKISVDENYMFHVTEKITNTSAKAIDVNSFAQIIRKDTPKTSGYYILHEGPLGIVDGKLQELSYDKIKDEKLISAQSSGGWIGVSDKYWLVAMIQDKNDQSTTQFQYVQGLNSRPAYITSFESSTKVLQSGESFAVSRHIYTGPKKLKLLQHYEKELGVDRFNLAIDFGWLWFLTKPTFQLLELFHKFFGNFGLSVLAMTVLFKLLLFPLANKSYRSMSRMKKFQPKLEELKARFGDDRLRLNQEMMTLYRKEKINPVSGCLPMVIQAPIFFCLYKVFFITIEMRHAPFWGWIQDLSAPDPLSIFNLFGLIPITLPNFLEVGLWPVIMGLTMFLQQRLNPQPTDPTQAKVFMMMPLVLVFVLAQFPAGLVIYWAWSNILTIAQQWLIMRLDEKSIASPVITTSKKSSNKNGKR